MLALVLAASAAVAPPHHAAAQQGPWLEMSAGPMVEYEPGRPGLSRGPLMRLHAGRALGERFAAEVWVAGALSSAPLSRPGDHAVVGGGLGGRLRIGQLDAQGRAAIWAHLGLGYGAGGPEGVRHGPLGFAGAALLYQPVMKRFAFGVEMNATATTGGVGMAVLPTLRCAL